MLRGFKDKSKIRLRFEVLEDRRVLATFTVNEFDDAAPTITECVPAPAQLNLRDAITLANECESDDTIQFSPGTNTIGLTEGPLNVSDDLIIRGGIMPTQQLGRGDLRINQTVFEPFQSRMGFEQLAWCGDQVRWIFLSGSKQV